MNGLNINMGSSIIKREAKPLSKVETQMRRNGWEKTGQIGDRVSYMESSNVNLTLVEGPLGTVVLPSGPLRGAVFGDYEVFSRSSVMGIGSSKKSDKKMGERNRTPSKSDNNRTTL